MADPKHLEILRRGMEEWNIWRNNNHVIPDLQSADLDGARLEGMNLSYAYLSGASLKGARLSHALLFSAQLDRAELEGADLRSANLSEATLRKAELAGANLNGAELTYVDLSYARASNADFSGATVWATNFTKSILDGADFTSATFDSANFGENDLSTIKGLEYAIHSGPSMISIDTLIKSAGKIPEEFLRGCGVPEGFITYMHSLTVQPIQFYKSFISYSSKDQKFADRLYADLQNKGVRCWLATEDLKIGARIRVGIDEAIRLHDKLLLVLSKHSVASDWVEQEVETALERERREKRTLLFPIRLDDAVMKVETGWPALIRNTRNIGDFRKWKNHDSYQKAFDRLLRDLKAEA